MKKKLLLLFTAACMIVSLLPFVAMIFHPTEGTIGNERETLFPSYKDEEGKFNTDFLSQMGDYFSKHFAFRPEIITADAKIQEKLFMTSNISSVICGKNDWLYYSSTKDDYTGSNPMSEDEIAALVNNLEIIQTYSHMKGAEFLFTIAPNKNTLYPENMPYYYIKSGEIYNRDTVSEALEKSDINYCNLFTVFEKENEVLYFARDSHWNNKGALLAYNNLEDSLGKSHEDYVNVTIERKKDFTGDLEKMVFPASKQKEFNFYYGAEKNFTYLTDTKSVEESLITTHSDNSSGNLYMYRDSFGNALLPFMASSYNNATFTKSFPMILDNDFSQYNPDTFIMEIAERNIKWFIERPPVVLSPEIVIHKTGKELSRQIDAEINKCEYSPAYVEVSGTVDEDYINASSVYVTLKCKDGEYKTRKCYTIFETGKRGYLAYFDSEEIDMSSNVEISVIIKDGDGFTKFGTSSIKFGGQDENIN